MPLHPNGTLLGVYLTVFIGSLGMGVYQYFVPVFAQRLGASLFDLGLIGTAGALPYAVFPLLIGVIADRVNRAYFFVFAVLFNALAAALLLLSRSVWDVILFRAVGGLGFALFWPTSEILVVSLSPAESRVGSMGQYSVAWASGFLIGPAIGSLVFLLGGDFTTLFAVAAFVIAVGVPLGLVTFSRGYRPAVSTQLRNNATQHVPPASRRIGFLYAAIIPYGVIFSVVVAIVPGFATILGVTEAQLGLLFSGFGIVRVAAFFRSEWFARWGERRALVGVALALSAAMLGVASSVRVIDLVLPLLLVGLSLGVFYPLSISALSRQFAAHRMGFAVGLYEMLFGIGFAGGPLLAGYVGEVFAPRAPYLLLVGVSLVMVPLLVAAQFPRSYPSPRPQLPAAPPPRNSL